MASSLWTTGNALIYAGYQPRYLGTARVKPYIELRPEFSNFYSDELGRKVPRDVSFDMEHAYITIEFNRFDEAVYEFLTVAKYTTDQFENPGTYEFDAMGTMIVSESVNTQLWIQFPYSAVTAFAGMPAGYHFPCVSFEGPERFTDLGVSDRAITMMWHAIPQLQSGTGGQGTNWKLYDFTLSNLPAPT